MPLLHHHLFFTYRLCVSEVGSLSMAAAGELRSPVSCSSEPDDSMEPYTTERLSRLPGGYKPLTEPFTALNIDFNNVQVSRNREDADLSLWAAFRNYYLLTQTPNVCTLLIHHHTASNDNDNSATINLMCFNFT